MMKNILRKLAPFIDPFLTPFTFLSAILFLVMRKTGMQHFKINRKILMKIGVFPIMDHFYEPMFNPKHLIHPLSEDRLLPGIDLNVTEQLNLLSKFHFNDELRLFPLEKTSETEFYYHNDKFGAGDAEYYYNIIRFYKPKTIIEVGAGNSTLMAINAIRANTRENPEYNCQHICIEPYERPWLERLEVPLIRERVEKVDKALFSQLGQNDILYIDSSHVIRPQGDVLFENLKIFPDLKSGVLVHIHDIFTPKDYPEWDFVHFFNEQYLVEAFLTCNTEFKIIGALNYLQHNHFSELASKCPVLKSEPDKVAGSFWIVKR